MNGRRKGKEGREGGREGREGTHRWVAMEDVVVALEGRAGPNMGRVEAALLDVVEVGDEDLVVDARAEFAGTEVMHRVQVRDVDTALREGGREGGREGCGWVHADRVGVVGADGDSPGDNAGDPFPPSHPPSLPPSLPPPHLVGHGALVSVLVDIHGKEDHVHPVDVLEEHQTLAFGGKLVRVVLRGGRAGEQDERETSCKV